MKGMDLLLLMSHIDKELIERADVITNYDKAVERKRNISLIISLVCVAVVFLVVVMVPLLSTNVNKTKNIYSNYSGELLCSVTIDSLDGLEYTAADAEDRLRYGLPAESEDVILNQDDVGEYIGKVKSVNHYSGENIVGNKVYHYSKYPKDNSIVLVDFGGTYSIFCTYGYTVSIPLGDSLSAAFNVFNLPEKGVRINKYDYDGNLVSSITDRSVINDVIALLADCENIGFEEQNRRLCRIWYDEYENDYVYYDEKSHSIIYRNIEVDDNHYDRSDPDESIGVETAAETPRVNVEDMADELWNKDSFDLSIVNDEGYRMNILVCPSTCSFSVFDGSFVMHESDMKFLKKLTE